MPAQNQQNADAKNDELVADLKGNYKKEKKKFKITLLIDQSQKLLPMNKIKHYCCQKISMKKILVEILEMILERGLGTSKYKNVVFKRWQNL